MLVCATVWVAAAGAAELPEESSGQFQVQLAAMESLAGRCAAAANACAAAEVPHTVVVNGAPGGAFTADWLWLADALEDAKSSPEPTRMRSMESVRVHLRELMREAGQNTALPAGEADQARHTADEVLARPEFRSAEGPSWWDRQVARFEAWLGRIFEGLNRVGKAAPWLAPLVEWGCFALALAGLLWFVRRSLARQVLRLSFEKGTALASVRGQDAAQWLAEAERHADEGAWRDALHGLYWAAIATLEGRRAWKPNATRTPREYLQLLQPGSQAYRAVRELTRLLERGWYGHDAVTEVQFRAAQALLDEVQTARPERVEPASISREGAPVATAGGLA